jgi:hypothetical protein
LVGGVPDSVDGPSVLVLEASLDASMTSKTLPRELFGPDSIGNSHGNPTPATTTTLTMTNTDPTVDVLAQESAHGVAGGSQILSPPADAAIVAALDVLSPKSLGSPKAGILPNLE